jgi:hypothetical protein
VRDGCTISFNPSLGATNTNDWPVNELKILIIIVIHKVLLITDTIISFCIDGIG